MHFCRENSRKKYRVSIQAPFGLRFVSDMRKGAFYMAHSVKSSKWAYFAKQAIILSSRG